MMATGLFFHATSPLGLEPTSTAFFRQAGMVRLFSGDKKDAVGVLDTFPEPSVFDGRGFVAGCGIVIVEVVKRQVTDFQNLGMVVGWEESNGVDRDLAGMGARAQAADEDGNLFMKGHAGPFSW